MFLSLRHWAVCEDWWYRVSFADIVRLRWSRQEQARIASLLAHSVVHVCLLFAQIAFAGTPGLPPFAAANKGRRHLVDQGYGGALFPVQGRAPCGGVAHALHRKAVPLG